VSDIISYNPSAIENTQILTETQKIEFAEIADDIKLSDVIRNKSLVNKMNFGFVYTSAKIEGNQYTLVEAETLLKTKKPSGNHTLQDANMLRNISNALRYCLKHNPSMNANTIINIHSILSSDLELFDEAVNFGGKRRNFPVFIEGSAYEPLEDFELLEHEFSRMFEIYDTIKNPYERAIYIHDNLAYLQYFADCNKRTARIACALSLINANLPFFAFNEMKADEDKFQYLNAVKRYYETNKHDLTVRVFLKQHEYVNSLAKRAGLKRDDENPEQTEIESLQSNKP